MLLMGSHSAQSARHVSRVLFALCLFACAKCRPTTDTNPFVADCRGWCQFDMTCDGGPDNTAVFVDSCEDALELDAVDYGPDCEKAYKAAMACVADMTCDEYHVFQNVPVDQGPCPDVLAPYYDLCPGVFIAPDRPNP